MTGTNGTHGTDWADLSLTAAQRKALAGPPIASPWDVYERLFADYRGGHVFDYAHGFGGSDIRAIEKMLDSDGTARQVEQVLTLPLRGADWAIDGGTDKGRKLVGAALPFEQMEMLIAQATSAVAYWRAFFELRWELDGNGVALAEYQLVPAASCEAAYRKTDGRPDGFRQRIGNSGLIDPTNLAGSGQYPGYVLVPGLRSFIYTHGTHRHPRRGTSDLAVCRWAYETRQKVLFLWLRFLENQSLPNVIFYGDDETKAQKNAQAFAQLKGAGTLGVKRGNDPTAKVFDVVESSGQGAGQFLEAIRYLQQQMVDSVLAGFTQLAGAAASGTGSYALSADQSEFFLASRQATADELAAQIGTGLFRLIVGLNGGSQADVPTLRIGPLSNRTTDRALDTLGKILTAPSVNAPDDFVSQLLVQAAAYLGLDPDRLDTAITKWLKEKAADQKRMAEQMAQGGPNPDQLGGDAGPAQPRRGPATPADQQLANTVDGAHHVVALAAAGVDPADALAQMEGRPAA